MREQQLNEVLFDYKHAATTAAADDDPSSSSMMMIAAGGGPLSSTTSSGVTDMSLRSSVLQDEDPGSSSVGSTPMRSIVKAYLPKKMTTVVRTFTSVFITMPPPLA